jgi:hypothetical protein
MCESCSVIDLRNPPSLSSEGDWDDFADTQNESVEEEGLAELKAISATLVIF